MDIIEEGEYNQINKELDNSNSNLKSINTDLIMGDLSSAEPTPIHVNTYDKNINYNKMNVATNKF